MNAEPSPLTRRLAALRAAGKADLAPLWAETLAPEEALSELSGRPGPVFDLQRARFLAEVGRAREALEILNGLGALPEGLEAVRERLRGAAEALPVAATTVSLSSRPDARLEGWLGRVRRWRSELRV